MYLIIFVKDKGEALWLELAKLKLSPLARGSVITVMVNWWIKGTKASETEDLWYKITTPHLRRSSKLEEYSKTEPQMHISNITCHEFGLNRGLFD